LAEKTKRRMRMKGQKKDLVQMKEKKEVVQTWR
jgi:hypothetical protein